MSTMLSFPTMGAIDQLVYLASISNFIASALFGLLSPDWRAQLLDTYASNISYLLL